MTLYGTIFKILFRRFSSRQRSTLCLNFVKFVWQEIGEIVRYLLDKTKTKFRLLFQTVVTVWITPKPFKVGNPSIFKSYASAIYNGSWQLTTDS